MNSVKILQPTWSLEPTNLIGFAKPSPTCLATHPELMARLQTVCDQQDLHRGGLFALILLDLDRFQILRCSLGNLAAQMLLAALSQRLSLLMGEDVMIAHLQDDRFAILLSNIHNLDLILTYVQQIRNCLKAPFKVESLDIFLTVSIGITTSAISDHQPALLLSDAELANCKAKMTGGDSWVMFDTTLRERTVERFQLENDLRLGLLRQEFFLEYQPIVSLENRELLGVEALVRWQHPRRGLVSPGEFIPIAEATGSIIPLGWWVLETACQQLKNWQRQFPGYADLSINVNLSGQQFSQPDFMDRVDQVLQQTGLAGQSLKLEITETVLMANADLAAIILEQLKKRGIRLCIDDFGTGYSSLSYLQRFEISTLKIDRSFIARIGNDQKSVRILQIILMLAQHLDMDVVAEGIEMSEQYWQLRALQCQQGQGYLFRRPLPAESMATLLTQPDPFAPA
jgi:diguanylate cyclase (GGDEF)-like protein